MWRSILGFSIVNAIMIALLWGISRDSELLKSDFESFGLWPFQVGSPIYYSNPLNVQLISLICYSSIDYDEYLIEIIETTSTLLFVLKLSHIHISLIGSSVNQSVSFSFLALMMISSLKVFPLVFKFLGLYQIDLRRWLRMSLVDFLIFQFRYLSL